LKITVSKHVSVNPESGYTLLETLIALSVLLVIAVPLVTFLFRISGADDSEKALTGMCILEQEATVVRVFPKRTVPVKRRVIDGKEWIITTEVTGSDLPLYRMSVKDEKKVRGELVFYGRGE
jgi:prepilin-type N-terminal cleavage/methylation domain-containing protein